MHAISKKVVHTLNWALFLVPVLNIFWVLMSLILTWPNWWLYINYEKSPLTWFSSVQLFTIGLTALCLSIVETNLVGIWLWRALCGVFLFFSFDERFQIHEMLREKVFKPSGIGTELPGIGAGDFLFTVFAVIGVIFGFLLIRKLRPSRPVMILFVLAITISAVATMIDAQPIQVDDIPAARLEQFWEEILETLAQAFFLTSFVMWLRDKWMTVHEA
jgi:hypothetical protein